MKTLFYSLFILGSIYCTKAQNTRSLEYSGPVHGTTPFGDLISDGSFLYGLTYEGGSSNNCLNGCGVIFKIKPDGTGYEKVFDLTGKETGSNPRGSLISDGTYLYGMCTFGGSNDMGTVFKVKGNGSGFKKLLDFDGLLTGSNHFNYGSLIYDGNYLYGMTTSGGENGDGVIFKIKPDGSDFTKLFDFSNKTTGKNPTGTLFFNGSFLFGMTQTGGIADYGTIFKIKPDGTSFQVLFDFVAPTIGSFPPGTTFPERSFLEGIANNEVKQTD